MSSFASDDGSGIEPLDGTVVNETPREPEASVTVDIVRAVAEAEGADPAELPVLGDVVDPEALEELVADAADRAGVRVSFRYCGYTVVVTADAVTLLSDEGA